MAKKKKSRLKKFLKRAAKAALIGGALYAGAKAFGGRKGKGTGVVSTVGQPVGVDRTMPPKTEWIKKVKKDKILPDTEPDTEIDYSKGDWRGFNHPLVQGNIQKKNEYIKRNTIGGYGSAVAPPSILNPPKTPFQKKSYRSYVGATGGRVAAKKGGRVTGIAKRGFGRALGRGKK